MKKILIGSLVLLLLVSLSTVVVASSASAYGIDFSYQKIGEFSLQNIADLANVVSGEGMCWGSFATLSLANPLAAAGAFIACLSIDYIGVNALAIYYPCNQVFEVWVSSLYNDIVLIPTQCISW